MPVVRLHEAAQRQIRKISRRAEREAIYAAIDKLALEPRPAGVAKLKVSGGDLYRVRVRDWRIVYTVVDDKLLVLVVQVGNRRDAYDNLDVLVQRVDHWLRRL